MDDRTQPNTTATAIGEVQQVTGRVVAIGADGVERVLLAGDLVFADDLIKTVGTSAVVIALNDGTRFELGRNAEALLEESVFTTDIESLRAAAQVDIAEIQRLIAEGADPAEVTEDPAAGGEEDGGGESVQSAVDVSRTGRVGVVEAGFETNGLEREFGELFAQSIDFGIAVVDPADTDPNDAITLTVTPEAADFVEGSTNAGDPVATSVANDPDGGNLVYSIDDTINYAIDPSTGVVTLTGPGAAIVNAGNDLPNFTVSVASTTGQTSSTNAVVDPADTEMVNDAPAIMITAINDFTEDSGAAVGDLVASYTTSDEDGDTVTVTLSDTVNYTLDGSGNVNLTAAGLALVNNGDDLPVFTLTPNDGTVDGAAASVDPAVTPVNDPPVANNDVNSLVLGVESSVGGNVLSNDTDVDTPPSGLSVAIPGNQSGTYGDLSLNADGTYAYTVDAAAAQAGLLGPTAGLVAHWTFDSQSGGIVQDVAPTPNATNVNLNGDELTGDGQINGAVEMDGNSRLTMSNSNEINVGGVFAERTVTLHFNADSVSGRQVLYEEGAQVRGLNIYIDEGNLYVGGWNTPGDESGWGGSWINLGTVAAGQWNHVALVLDASADPENVRDDVLTAYLNGNAVVDTAAGSQLWSHSGDVSIGGSGGNGNSRYHDGTSSARNYFSGRIDDVRVYNASLTESDVVELAAQDGTLTDSFTYNADDGDLTSNPATLEITINAPPLTSPSTADGEATGVEDAVFVFSAADFPFSDADAGDALQAVRIVSLPAAGVLQFFDGTVWQPVAAGQEFSAAEISAGNLRFVPDPNASGVDAYGGSGSGDQQADYATFDFAVSDGVSFSTPATFVLDVAPVADLPALSASIDTTENVVVQTLLDENFNDGDFAGWSPVNLGLNQVGLIGEGVGRWEVDNGVLEQNDPSGSENTFLQFDSTPDIQGLENYELSVEIDPNRSGTGLGTTNNGGGFVFAYQDNQNYYRVEWINYSSTYQPGGSNADDYGGGELYKDFRLIQVTPSGELILDHIEEAEISSGGNFTLTLTVDSLSGIQAVAVGDGGTFTLSHSDAPLLDGFGLYSWDNDNDIGFDNVTLTRPLYEYDLTVAASLVDTDGSENLSVTLSDLPAGSGLSAGTDNGDGTWTVDPTQLSGLKLVAIESLSDPGLTVSATATEAANADQASNIQSVGGDGILVGGPGDDLFIGGAGSDEFQWTDGDQGADGSPAVDTIADFTRAEGDALNLADLLGSPTGDLTEYLHFEQSDDGGVTNTVVQISSSGGFSSGYDPSLVDQTIVLQGVDLTALGDDQAIIDALVTGNNLIT